MEEYYRPERIGLIDLGSNSARFVVMAIEPSGAYHLIYQDKQLVRLSEGLAASRVLSKEARDRTLHALQVFAHTAELLGVEQMLAVATAAMRNAKNGMAFRDEIEAHTGIPLTIISGREEARLGYLGVVNTLACSDFILFDLGGASTEISLIRDHKLCETRSLPIGTLTLTEEFGTADRITAKARKALVARVRKELATLPIPPAAGLPLVGIGGTIRNIAKIHQRRENYPIPKLHNYLMPADQIGELTDLFCSLDFTGRTEIPGLGPDRADIISAGALLIHTLVDYCESPQLIISGNGLREGLFFHHYAIHYRHGRLYPDNLLAQSVQNYRATLALDEESDERTEYITTMALRLYDELQPVHGFAPRWRSLLETAARLHDIGVVINFYSHAQHSAYMLANAPLYGLSHAEQSVCALLAGFQDGISGKLRRYENFARVPTRDEVKTASGLSVLLALAKKFDYMHDRGVLALHTDDDTKTRLHLTARAPADIPLLENGFARHLTEFENQFGIPLEIIWENADIKTDLR